MDDDDINEATEAILLNLHDIVLEFVSEKQN